MSNPERARDLAARLAAEVGVKTIIAAAKFGHLLLGGSPKLRPPAFDEAEAQRFLSEGQCSVCLSHGYCYLPDRCPKSDGAEELAVAEERDEVSEPFWAPFVGPDDHVSFKLVDGTFITERHDAEPADIDRAYQTIASAYSTLDSCIISNYAPATSIRALTVPRAESADQTTSALMAALINQVRLAQGVYGVYGDKSRSRYIDELIADSEARAAQHEQVGD